MAAEFAVTLPVVVLVLAFCLQALALAGARILVIDAASQGARLLGRGEIQGEVSERLNRPISRIEREAGLLCVTITDRAGLLPVVARACALDEGR